jgi:hypothetical protein
MNTAEHIVESYFRLCRGCFTCSDRKVVSGNNRQLDILAYNLKDKVQFHVEVGVTHRPNWCPTREDLGVEFERKFFGVPPVRTSKAGGATDFEKNKAYFEKIEETYANAGFSPADVKRVWVCWIVKCEGDNTKPLVLPFTHLNRAFEIEVLSLRDCVIPELMDATGTANYDDEILRTLGFIKQREMQTTVA